MPLEELTADDGDAPLIWLLTLHQITVILPYLQSGAVEEFAAYLTFHRVRSRHGDIVASIDSYGWRDARDWVQRKQVSASATVAFETPSRRQLNAVVTDTDRARLLDSVAAAERFLVRLRVGRAVAETIIPGRLPFPDDQLPRHVRGWDLTVLATGDGLRVDDRPRRLFLPARGASWSCDCPMPGHRCGGADRSDWLDLPAEAPAEPGVTRLTIGVYHGAVLLQATEIVVPVGPDAPAPAGRIVYTRDPDFRNPGMHDHRGMSCHLAPAAGGAHTLVVNNGHHQPVRVAFADRQGDTAAAALRRVLYDTHLDAHAAPRHRIGARGEPVKDRDAYLADLRRLAGAGAVVYRALLSEHDNERRLRDWLAVEAANTGAPPVIQVARSATARISVPWQALYTEPLVDGPAAAAVCPSVWVWGPGGSGSAPPAVCPDRDGVSLDEPVTTYWHDSEGTICPFGFWGLAHVVEHPPSSVTRILPRTTGTESPPRMVVAAHPGLGGIDGHLDRVRLVVGDPAIPVATGWPMLRSVAAEGSDVLYFLCHGLIDEVDGLPVPQPVLDLGGENRITPARLSSWAGATRWRDRLPLVILNGCATGDMLSDLLAGFVDVFVNSLRGAGVIATEVAVESCAAQYVAETLLTRLWSGSTVGMALRATRWDLLASGSVLGLAYTPYCDAYLTLPEGER